MDVSIEDQDSLMDALVHLAEVLDCLHRAWRYEYVGVDGRPPLSATEVAVVGAVLRRPARSAAEIAQATGEPLPEVARAALALVRRGMLSEDGARPSSTRARFSASSAAVDLQERARQRAERHLRYALAALGGRDIERLRTDADALESLAGALGFRPLHSSYLAALPPATG